MTAKTPTKPCVHHWRQHAKRPAVTLFRCVNVGCTAERSFPTDPPLRAGATSGGFRKTLLGDGRVQP